MEWNAWDEQVRGLYAGEQLAPPAGVEAAVFRRLDRWRWMRRLAAGCAVGAVALGGYVAFPAAEEPVSEQPVAPVLLVSPAAEIAEPAGVQPQENAEAARPEATVQKNSVSPAASAPEMAAEQPAVVGTARRIEPSRMHGLDREERLRRSDAEERWVLPASIEVKD
ncbi:MAG: hypothetical protein ACO3YQ_08780 [Flavobacteriales bacterium]